MERDSVGERPMVPATAGREDPYGQIVDLEFTSAYVGIVHVAELPSDAIYELIRGKTPAGLTTWYYDHPKGAVWIGVAGEHAEPILEWFDEAHERLPCTTMLGAILANGSERPPSDSYALLLPRKHLALEFAQVLQASFTIYVPHIDEFHVFTEPRVAISAISSSNVPNTRFIGGLSLHHRHQVESTRRSRSARYDPVEAQVREVLAGVTESARRAARDLVRDWRDAFGEPAPSDLVELENSVLRERDLIGALYSGRSPENDARAIMAGVDRHAREILRIRRTAVDLSSQLRDYRWPPTQRPTYRRVSTRLTLKAMQRYAGDVARRLGIQDHTFVPVVGHHFETTTHLIRTTPIPPRTRVENTTVVIQVPPDVLLRLGAMPLIAHQVAAAMDDRLDEISNALVHLDRNRFSELHEQLPPLRLHGVRDPDADVARHRSDVRSFGRDLATDLLAAAVAGPPFLFALARFAAGSGGESRIEFLRRLSACLGILEALGRPTIFRSNYVTAGGTALPSKIVELISSDIVETAPREEEIWNITERLRAGHVVDAPPVAILEALWRAVAARSGYLHEIAALISVAGDEVLAAAVSD